MQKTRAGYECLSVSIGGAAVIELSTISQRPRCREAACARKLAAQVIGVKSFTLPGEPAGCYLLTISSAVPIAIYSKRH